MLGWNEQLANEVSTGSDSDRVGAYCGPALLVRNVTRSLSLPVLTSWQTEIG
jgi:hypothetical protein